MEKYRLVRITIDKRGLTQRIGQRIHSAGRERIAKELMWEGSPNNEPTREWFIEEGILVEVDPDDEGDLLDDLEQAAEGPKPTYTYELEKFEGRCWWPGTGFGDVRSDQEPLEELPLDEPTPEAQSFMNPNDE